MSCIILNMQLYTYLFRGGVADDWLLQEVQKEVQKLILKEQLELQEKQKNKYNMKPS